MDSVFLVFPSISISFGRVAQVIPTSIIINDLLELHFC